MRALKNILIGLGVLFVVILALFAWVGMSSRQFRKEEAPFVEKFVTDLSKRWDTADVNDRMTSSFIIQAGTLQSQQLLHQFKELGASAIVCRLLSTITPRSRLNHCSSLIAMGVVGS